MLKELDSDNIVITDASCFIVLGKIGTINILNELYSKVFTTPEIAAEYGKQLPAWVNIQSASNRTLFNEYANLVDRGEASAIALAFELPSSTLILDDLAGRKLADQLNLKYTGTLGLLVKAKQQGIIPKLTPYFDKIKKTDFRVSAVLLQTLLDRYDV